MKVNVNCVAKSLVLRALMGELFIVLFWVSGFYPVLGHACSSPLGVEVGNASLTADSYTDYRYIAEGKLNFEGGRKGWCQVRSNKGYLQVKFKEERFVTGVATQGSGQGKGQVLKYKLQFSVDETEWWDYMEDGTIKIFDGNHNNTNDVVRNNLTVPVRALLIRFRPLHSRGLYTCLRVEAYGCKACGLPLGFEDGRIPNSAFTTPEILMSGFEAYRARLNKASGGKSWCPPKKSDDFYLRIDLGKEHTIDAILTQGNPNHKLYYYTSTHSISCSSTDPAVVRTTNVNNVTTCTLTKKNYSPAFVKSYLLDYSIDGIRWKTYGEKGEPNKVLTANRDNNTVVRASLFPKPRARYITYRPTISWYNHCSRLEILGCEACMGEIGISHGRIPNQQMTASSNAGSDFQPWLARLNNPSRAWCANKSDSAPFLQLDLWCIHKIRHISTQGFSSTRNSWVEKYTIDFSSDGEEWFTYKENGVKKVFTGNSDSETEVKTAFSSPIFAVFIRVRPTNWTGDSACLRLELYGCKAASDGLGMETGEITAVTSNHYLSSSRYPRYGKLNNGNGFEAYIPSNPEQFLFYRVDLGSSAAIITGIATQEGLNHVRYVRRYSLRFSDQMLEWITYKENGITKIFEGNHLKHTIVRYNFRTNVTARYVELVVKEGSSRAVGLRMELYGIKHCEQPLGMENGQISNDFITSSASKSTDPPWKARLNGNACWCGTEIYKSYLEINLQTLHRITAIGVQGNPNGLHYVNKYQLSFRAETPEWEIYKENAEPKVFNGATTKRIIVIDRPKRPIIATMIRIKPVAYKNTICMRVEIYGCKEIRCSSPFGLTTFQEQENKISASSTLGPSYLPNYGRLATHLGYGAWCAAVHDSQQFLQIDFPRIYVISGFATQGKHQMSNDGLGDAWVTSYKVSYSKGLFHWEYVQDVNYTEVLVASVKNSTCNTSIANNSATSYSNSTTPSNSTISSNGTIFANSTISSNGTIFANSTISSNGTIFANSTISSNDTIFANSTISSNGTISNNRTSNCTQTNTTIVYTVQRIPLYFVKIFPGNSRHNITVKHILTRSFKGKAMRFHPQSWFNIPCMRVELFGCKGCFTPLGMIDGKIGNSAIKANGWRYAEPYYARLYGNYYWRCDYLSDKEFLHIYVGPQTKFISAVATESPSSASIKAFSVSFSPNGGDWMDYMENGKIMVFAGPINIFSFSLNHFAYPLQAQYFKLIPKTFASTMLRLKVELYGCAADCYEPLGASLADENFEADSSDISGGHHPSKARMNLLANIAAAWCPADQNVHHKLTVNLGKSYRISQVAMRGYNDLWTAKVRLYYKDDMTPMVMYTNNFGNSDFPANTNDSSIKRIFIKYPFKANSISFYALDVHNRSCMSVEIYTCKECHEEITSNQEFETNSGVQASSYFDPNFAPKFGSMRYSATNHGWCAQSNDAQQFLQFDYLLEFKITSITTSGSAVSPNGGSGSWVTRYRIEYSTDGQFWRNYTENGNTKIFSGNDSYQDVNEHLVARYVRLIPTEWQNWICMKASLTGCSDCSSPLGLETKKLKAVRGSYYHSYRYPYYGVLHSIRGFVPRNYFDFQSFLEIQLKNSRATISAVAMQPDYHDNKYVWTYYLSYNLDGEQWFDYSENGATRHFRGYRDRETAVKSVLSRPITVRFIRFNPLRGRYLGLRVELYGCQACEKPLGMRSGLIPNTSITASTYKPGYEPWMGRIGSNGIWCSQVNSVREYFQVDLGVPTQISGIEIEGDAVSSKYVRNFLASYSTDEGYWKIITKDGETRTHFEANWNDPSFKIVNFPRPVTARYVRISPQSWKNETCMRIELRGCRDVQKENCISTIGIEYGYIKNDSFSASSSLGPDYQPWFARLNTHLLGGGWCAGLNNSNQYLQVNLIEHYQIKKLFLQGKAGSTSAWLTKFSIQYSLDGSAWTNYRQQSNEVFDGCRHGVETLEMTLDNPFIARYIRIRPREWRNWVCMRLEAAGCKVLAQAYGLETQEVENSLLSGSYQNSYHRFEEARLYYSDRYISDLRTGDEYLEITFQPFGKVITAFAVQGVHWLVTLYTLRYSVDEKNWIDYHANGKVKMFRGPEDLLKVSRVVLSRPILASKLRIAPKQWILGTALRTEFYGYDSCFDQLNIGHLPNSSFDASSSLPNHEPWRAKIGSRKNESWCPATSSSNEYLQIDIGETYLISAIATEGDVVKNCWINKFVLEYKKAENDAWQCYGKYRRSGLENITFRAADPLTPRYLVKMQHKLEARYIRIHPEESITCPCLRVQIYGCHACGIELGMASDRIKDDAITATGYLNPASLPTNARLYSKKGLGAWCAGFNETNPFLQIDLFWMHSVRSIAIQGRHDGAAWVEAFTLSYREDNKHWQNYSVGGLTKVFSANSDGSFVVKQDMNLERVRYLRIHPVRWHQAACLRLELYGCVVSVKTNGVALGMQSGSIPNSAITASYWNKYSYQSPFYARLFSSGAWVVSNSLTLKSFLLIDLGPVKTVVTRVATQGWPHSEYAVLEYHLSMSREGIFWFRYSENGIPKIFQGNSFKDTNTPVEHSLHHSILTRYLMFEVLRSYYRVSMRVEAYGYREYPKSLFGINSNSSSVEYVVTSSSNLSADPFPISYSTPGVSWCSEFKDSRQYMQVEFQRDVLVSGIRLEIMEATPSTKVVLFYAKTGQGLKPFKLGNAPKYFQKGTTLLEEKIIVSGIRIMPTWQDTLCLHFDILAEDMSNPIGFQDQRVPDQTMSASTQLSASTRPSNGRVRLDNVQDAWCAGEEDLNQYLKIDFGYVQVIDRVATQGRHTTGLDSWVTEYSLRYCEDGVEWKWCETESDTVKVFEGNADYYMVVQNKLPKPVRARYVEVHPRSWKGSMCMRVELYGYSACVNPLGMNSGLIPDSAISAVGTSAGSRYPHYGRLHKYLGEGAWCAEPSNAEKYLQIDLGINKLISGFSTEGSQGLTDAFVKTFKVSYRPNEGSWTSYNENNATKEFTGNVNHYEVVTHILIEKFVTRYIRFIVLTWNVYPCLRVELLGCEVPVIDGGYTNFTEWTECTVHCGGGTQMRSRKCTNPEPRNGGKNCTDFAPDVEIRKCNIHLCPAPNIKLKNRIFYTQQRITFAINNCSSGLNTTFDFGDLTVKSILGCTVSYQYTMPGIYEVLVSIPKHHSFMTSVYVQEKIRSIVIDRSVRASLVLESFWLYWKIVRGTLPKIEVNHGNGTETYNFFLGDLRGTYVGFSSHNYTTTGVYNITVIASNLVSRHMFITKAIVEEQVIIQDLDVTYLGIFDRYYQVDKLFVNITLSGGSNPHYRFIMDNGVIFHNGLDSTLLYSYPQAGTYNMTVEVYNNASRANITTQVIAHPVISINNDARLTVLPTVYLTPTMIDINLTIANPFECFCDFGDGNSRRFLSIDNLTVLPHVYASIGVYPVKVNCSNHFSSKTFRANAVVQKAITGLAFTNDGPKEMNETVTFKVSSTDWGSDSCYYVTLGDGTSHGFGKHHCRSRYPGAGFEEISNDTYIMTNMYYAIKVFYSYLHAWNQVSEFKMTRSLPILKISCNYPNTTILNIAKDMKSPTNFTRLDTVFLEAWIKIDCRATQLTDLSWTYVSVSKDGVVGTDEKILEIKARTFIYPRTIDYGLYLLRFNVSMRGQEGVFKCDEGYFKVVPNDLRPIIDGGSTIVRGFDKYVYFDGYHSFDPDYHGTSDFEYYWYMTKDLETDFDLNAILNGRPIEESPQYNEREFCNMSFPRRIYKGGSTITLFTGRLRVLETYAVFLIVTRTIHGVKRWKETYQLLEVVLGDPPAIGIKCKRNCKWKVTGSDKFSLAGFCPEETPYKKVQYSWELQISDQGSSSSRRKRRSFGSLSWKTVKDLQNLTSTDTKQKFLVIKPNTLQGEIPYRLILSGKMYGRATGLSIFQFLVNKPPYGGTCTVDLSSGFADKTNFTFNCFDWKDNDQPLSYEHNYRSVYGLATLIYYGRKNIVKTKLPVGNPEKNFTTNFYVRVLDALGAYVEFQLPVQVKLPPGGKKNLMNKFSSALGNDSDLANYIKEGKVQEFTQEVNSLTSIINVFSEEKNGTEEERKQRQEVRTDIVKSLCDVKIKSLSALNQIGPTLASATVKKEEVPVKTQKLLLNSFENMANLFQNKVNDPESTSSSIEDAGVTIAFCMGNLIAAAGDSARVYGDVSPKDVDEGAVDTSRSQAKEISKRTSAVLEKTTSNLLSTKAPGEETMVISAPSMSIALARDFPEKISEKPIGDGKSVVGLPSSNSMFSNGTLTNTSHIDAKLLTFNTNPNTWDKSAEAVSSSMVSLKLQNDGGGEMAVSGLSQDIDIYIPRKVPDDDDDPANQNFMANKIGAWAYHRYNWTMEELPLSILAKGDVNLDVYIKQGSRPSDNDPKLKTIPDYSTCTEDDDGNYVNCVQDPYMITIDNSIVTKTGIYFIGLKNLIEVELGTNSRKRIDCGSGRRERRSCIKFKNPPPKPTGLPDGVVGGERVTVVPEFDPLKDVTYCLQTFKSPCMYWNEVKEAWSNEGCKTGPNTKLDLIHCQCNHLTGFGGGMLVKPNPIDFDQVWAGFANISDNLSVLLTICTAFGLYVLIALWCRKKDKQDSKKGGVTVIETDQCADKHRYLILVQTGAWQNSATTAKVSMNLFGQRGQSGPISLTDDAKQLFARGATNEFHLILPESLGSLLYLRVWHDMTGEDSSWFLSYVIVKELSTNQQWIFVCDRWLALEKDDGLVDRILLVSGDKELKNFKTLFRTKTSQDLFDGHLWLSVIGKPPKSNFTRLQRLSCCMSLLFTTMMTSAMFYNIGGTPDTSTIALGPLRFSVRQLMIGIQSSFIALPVNVIIIQIFRNARPKHADGQKMREDEESVEEKRRCSDVEEEEKEEEEGEKATKPEGIPFWTTYIAWTLCFLMTLVSATITLFYSMMWGKETSDQWLTSMLVSFFQDAFVSQPIKVCAIALFVAAVLKKLPEDFAGGSKSEDSKDKEDEDEDEELEEHIMFDKSLGIEPPDPKMIEKAREYKMKESQMYGIMKENVFHAVFVLMLVVISYTERDPMAYLQKKTLEDALNSPVSDPNGIWSYLDNTFLPFVYDGQAVKKRVDEEGFTAEKDFYIVGMPRLRQLRVKKGACEVNYTVTVCTKPYSAFGEEKSFFMPGWEKMTNLTPDSCPVPWKYKDFIELNGIPFWGQMGVYGGGGYTANLGYTIDQAKKIIADLKSKKWVDDQTRAIFLEFTIYNGYSNLFSFATYLIEMQGTGGSDSILRIETFRLYQNSGPGQTLVVLCQLAVVIITIVLAYVNAKKIYHMRKEYFKNTWNTIQLIVIILTLSAVVLVVIRLLDAKRTMDKLEENPFLYINFQYTTKWAEINIYVVAFIVFLMTLKFLYLMSFNHHIIVLYRTVVHAKPSLGLLATEAFILLASLVSFAYLVFGSNTQGFGSVFLTVQTLFAMLLGKAYFTEMSTTEPFLGPTFFVLFAILMIFFLMNMFMAILMDCYEMGKEDVAAMSEESDQFEIADFMLQRLKVILGVGAPPPRAPWQEPALKYIPGVDEETQRRRELRRNMEELPSRVQGIQKTLTYINSMDEKTTLDSLTFAELFLLQYSSGKLDIQEEDKSLLVEYLQEG